MTIEKSSKRSNESRWILTVGPKDDQTFSEFYRDFARIDEMLQKSWARKVELRDEISMRDATHRHEYVFEGDHNKFTQEMRQWPWYESFSWMLYSGNRVAIEEVMQHQPMTENVPPALTLDNKVDRIEQLLVHVGVRLHRLERRSRPKCWEVQVNLEEYARGGGGRYDMFHLKEREAIDIARESDGEHSHTEDVVVELTFRNRTQAYAAVTAITRAGFKRVGVFPWHDDEIEMLERNSFDHEERLHQRTMDKADTMANTPEAGTSEQKSDDPNASPGDHETTG
jgi:hypothetical protein